MLLDGSVTKSAVWRVLSRRAASSAFLTSQKPCQTKGVMREIDPPTPGPVSSVRYGESNPGAEWVRLALLPLLLLQLLLLWLLLLLLVLLCYCYSYAIITTAATDATTSAIQLRVLMSTTIDTAISTAVSTIALLLLLYLLLLHHHHHHQCHCLCCYHKYNFSKATTHTTTIANTTISIITVTIPWPPLHHTLWKLSPLTTLPVIATIIRWFERSCLNMCDIDSK